MTTDLDTVRKWNEAVKLHDKGEHQKAIDQYRQIRAQNNKFLFNVGCDFLSCGQTQKALEAFQQCVQRDVHLAIGYFQCAICLHKIEKYRDAALNWNMALEKMRGNTVINYSQMRLPYHLYDCEIRHNLALTLLYLGNFAEANRVMGDAVKHKVNIKHDTCITQADEACRKGSPFPLMELPKYAVFRPDKTLVRNMSKKDYTGKKECKVLVGDDTKTGFSGKQLMDENDGKIPYLTPQPVEKKKNLLSRSLELLNIDDKDSKPSKSKSSEYLDVDEKKGTNVCASVQSKRLDFLRKNAPTKAPPRAPPQRPAPKLQQKPRIVGGEIQPIAPPQKIGRKQAVRLPYGKKSESHNLPSSSPSGLSPASEPGDIPKNEFDIKWKCLHDNQARDQAWNFTPPQDTQNVDSLSRRRRSSPAVSSVHQKHRSGDIGQRSHSLVPVTEDGNELMYVNLPTSTGSHYRDSLDSPDESDIPAYLQLVGGYSGLDPAYVEEISYADLLQEENIYEEVALKLKAGGGVLVLADVNDQLHNKEADHFYATPDDVEYYEDIEEMDLPTSLPSRPIKAKRPSRTTDDLPNRHNPELKVASRPSLVQVPRRPKTTDDLPKRTPPRRPAPPRPNRPPLPQGMQGQQLGLELPDSRTSRSPLNHGAPIIVHASAQASKNTRAFSKQYSADSGMQWLKREDQVSSDEKMRHGSLDSAAEGMRDLVVGKSTVAENDKPDRPPPYQAPPGGVSAIKSGLERNIPPAPPLPIKTTETRKVSGQAMLQGDQMSELAQILNRRRQKSSGNSESSS